MADQFTYAKLPSDPCLTQEQMMAYLDGKLSAAEQHACEKHMADCAMCEDAFEGLSLVKDRSVLSAPLKKVDSSSEKGKVVPLQKPAPKLRLFYAAAAVLVVVLASVFFMKNMTSPDAAQPLAEFTSVDSISSSLDEPVSMEKLDCVLQDYTVVVTDKNGASEGDESMRNAPMLSREESGFSPLESRERDNENMEGEMTEAIADVPAEEQKNEILFDANDFSLGEEVVVEDEKLKEAEVEEEDKKDNFWDRTKAAIPQTGGPERSEKKQSLAKDDAGVDSRQATQQSEPPKQDVKAPVPNDPAGGVVGAADSQKPEIVVAADTIMMAGNGGYSDQSYESGMDLLNAGQANAAIAMFDKVLADKNHPQYEDAEFQKANALIKANRKPEAKVLLQSIEAKKGKYAAQATELLKTL